MEQVKLEPGKTTENEPDPGMGTSISEEGELGTLEEIIVCQIRSQSMFKIPVALQDYHTEAVVDTAAEVTLMSDKVYKKLANPGSVIKHVTLNTAGREMKMNGFVVGPMHISIGNQTFEENIHVAPIQNDMLLGLDFLRRHQALINIPESYIQIGGENIAMVCGKSDTTGASVSRVVVCKTMICPPNSLTKVPCSVNDFVGTPAFLVESCKDNLLIPDTVFADTSQPVVNVLNLSDHHITVHKDDCVAHAQPVWVVPPTPT